MKLYCSLPSPYCQKALIAFKEKGIKFDPEYVNLMDPKKHEEYKKFYPIGKVPLLVLKDGYMIPESSIIIEYLDTHFDSGTKLIPTDPDQSRKTRFHDRMLDNYLNNSIGNLWWQSMKPENERDQETIKRSEYYIGAMYKYLNEMLEKNTWIMGDHFTMADCAAFGPLFYARDFCPFNDHPKIAAYFDRLMQRPSIKELVSELEPVLDEFKKKMAS